MDSLPLYFDATSGTYKIIDEELDNDSGVDEMPFLSYSAYGYDRPNQLHKSSSKLPLTWDPTEDEVDDTGPCLDYLDDETDDDYRPNNAYVPKKVKAKVRKNLKFSALEMSMFSPEKRDEVLDEQEESVRHYARKDRTPKTIQKMMERHRESERVRHHTLNESMRDVCTRVPGYNPDIKETKVIQMQRMIGYECFLENTVSQLCAELGVKSKALSSGTNYITEVMKTRNPEDWRHYRHMIEEEPCSSMEEEEEASLACQVISNELCPTDVENMTRYRREKISSPTVDSTTDNLVQVYHPSCQYAGSSVDNMWPTQSCLPMLSSSQDSLLGLDSSQDSCLPFASSQESGIRICSQDSSLLNEDFDTFLDENLVIEPENLKTVTAAFMREDKAPTCSLAEEVSLGFDLSSPLRADSNLLLRSPKSSGIWHHPVSLHYPDKSESLGSKEMTSVSPETLDLIETAPDVRPMNELQKSPDKKMHCYTYDIAATDVSPGNSSFGDQESELSGSKMSKVLYVKTRNTDTELDGYVKYIRAENVDRVDGYVTYTKVEGSNSEKNKRKRYTPLRARHPFVNLTNIDGDGEVKKPMTKVIKMCRKQDTSSLAGDQRVPDMDSASQCKRESTVPPVKHVYSQPQTDHSRLITERGRDVFVDHRRTSWMNGFMMFCHVNRQRFIDANPGVHISHIQKMLGHVWRNMQSFEKQPYKWIPDQDMCAYNLLTVTRNEKADAYSGNISNVCQTTAPYDDGTENIVPSSTTVDGEVPAIPASNDGTGHYTQESNNAIIIL